MHSEMWWPRLFRHHGEIAWDDYEKDYSDLPREVLEPHAVAELERDVVRQLEGADKDRREILQVMASCCLGAFAHGTVNTTQMNSFVVTAFESHERVS